MKFYFLILLALISSQTILGQQYAYEHIPQSNSSIDSARVMKITTVTEPCIFLSQDEKDVVQWLNVARMYPKWFLYFRKIRNIDPIYTKTLIRTLMTMEPIKKKLIPNKNLWDCALCHAQTTGPIGYVGHERQDLKCKKTYSAECISYGSSDGATYVELLLIDFSVPSLGHRISCLNPRYNRVGVSSMPHKKHRGMAVVDFGY